MPDLTLPHVLLLIAAGCAAGFVNTAAGAGSLLSLRAMMLLGMPAGVSNATNRLPVLAQSIAAGVDFDRGGKLDRSNLLRAAVPTSIGSLVGSLGASFVPEKEMRYILIVALLGMALFSLQGAKKAPNRELVPSQTGEGEERPDLTRPKAVVWLVVAGLYGGFLQAGVGLVLLFALGAVGGYDLIRANALKVVLIALFTVVSLTVFIARGAVAFPVGLVMCIGSVVGARLGVRYAIGHGEALKRLVVACDVIACAALLYGEIAGRR